MTIPQYEEIRRDPRLFLVSPGHEMPEIEDVAYREAGFVVVRKHDDVAEIVQQTDPRLRATYRRPAPLPSQLGTAR